MVNLSSLSSINNSARCPTSKFLTPNIPLTMNSILIRSSSSSTSGSHSSHASFGDALDAGRGMVAMSQDMTTPRNIYGPREHRGSTDSYGFPSTHSSVSSISGASSYGYYGSSAPSIDSSSVTDYSSAASDNGYDSLPSRTLPLPQGLLGSGLPPPQSMMGQFSSKVSSSTQKKHKCKVCDKRFTRPSSLQTHMYSHTGEKRKFSSQIKEMMMCATANEMHSIRLRR